MAGCGSCQTRRRLRGLGIPFGRAPSGASLLAFAASRIITGVFTRPARQHHDFCTDGLGDCIELRLAHMDLEKLKIAALYTQHGKTWKAFPFADPRSLAHENFC